MATTPAPSSMSGKPAELDEATSSRAVLSDENAGYDKLTKT